MHALNNFRHYVEPFKSIIKNINITEYVYAFVFQDVWNDVFLLDPSH